MMTSRSLPTMGLALLALVLLTVLIAGCAPQAEPMAPAAATGTAEATGVVVAVPGQQKWICTMCPEVVSDKPGICPKCGMTLVPKK